MKRYTATRGPEVPDGQDPDLARSTDFFQAVSHDVRQRILMLLQEGERSVGELVAEFDLSQPTISRHLAVLKRAGLVRDRRAGQQVFYALNEEEIRTCLVEFFSRFRCCAALGKFLGMKGGRSRR